jgi:CBS domain-containing protein
MDSRAVTTARNIVLCPACRAENIQGSDVCEVCGADLMDLGRPTIDTELEGHLVHDRLREMHAREAIDVGPADPVAVAVHKMRESETECVLVRDQDGKIVGILSERDILMKAAGARTDLMALAVKDIMTKDPVMLREEDSLAVALHKMSVGGFRHIPFVADDGHTLMISIQDVFRHVADFIPHE